MMIDHLRAIKSANYRAAISGRMSRIERGHFSAVAVLHEDDGSCCDREPWPITSSKIFAPLVAQIGDARDVA